MIIGNYLICKKNYYESSGFFVKPTFRKNKSYKIDNIIDPFSNWSPVGVQGSTGGCPVGPQGSTGVQGTSGGVQVVISTTTTPTTTTTTSTTTTTTYSTTICNYVTYVINGTHMNEWQVEEHFYSKQEERLIKLKKLKKNEKKI